MTQSKDRDSLATKTRRRKALSIAVSLLAGLGLFGAVLYFAGPEQLGRVREADPTWAAAAFGSAVAVTVVSAARWGYITNGLLGRPVLAWPQYYAALLTSRVVGLFTPRNASDVGIRFVTLVKVGGIGTDFAGTSVALDQLYDIVLIGVLLVPATLALSLSPSGWQTALLLFSLATAIGLMLSLDRFAMRAAKLLGKLAQAASGKKTDTGFLARRAEGLAQVVARDHLSPRQSVTVTTMTLGRYLLNAVMFWSIAQALNLNIGLSVFLLAGPLVQLSLLFAVTPGGLGIMDLGWVGALGLAGYPTETGAVFIVGVRSFQYLMFPTLAALSYFVLGIRGAAEWPTRIGRDTLGPPHGSERSEE